MPVQFRQSNDPKALVAKLAEARDQVTAAKNALDTAQTEYEQATILKEGLIGEQEQLISFFGKQPNFTIEFYFLSKLSETSFGRHVLSNLAELKRAFTSTITHRFIDLADTNPSTVNVADLIDSLSTTGYAEERLKLTLCSGVEEAQKTVKDRANRTVKSTDLTPQQMLKLADLALEAFDREIEARAIHAAIHGLNYVDDQDLGSATIVAAEDFKTNAAEEIAALQQKLSRYRELQTAVPQAVAGFEEKRTALHNATTEHEKRNTYAGQLDRAAKLTAEARERLKMPAQTARG